MAEKKVKKVKVEFLHDHVHVERKENGSVERRVYSKGQVVELPEDHAKVLEKNLVVKRVK